MHKAINNVFEQISRRASKIIGSSYSFIVAVVLILVWAGSGPLLAFSDIWQLCINTGTTILTFLMLFLLQNSVNRDQEAQSLKLDELIIAVKGSRNWIATIDSLSSEDLAKLDEAMRNRALQTDNKET